MDAQLITRNSVISNGNFPFGARENWGVKDFSYMWAVNNQIHSCWGLGSQTQMIGKGFDYNKHELLILRNWAYFDNKLERQFTPPDFQSPVSLYLFSCNAVTNPNSDYSFKGRIYYAKIWQDNLLVRYFVPVIDNATGKFGMYDLIEGKFYTSPNNVDFIGA